MRHKGVLVIILGAIFLLCLTYFISVYFNIPFSQLSKDPLFASGVNPINGMLSNMGAVYWSISLGISFFTYFILGDYQGDKTAFFLLYSGFMSLLLLTDDLMMVHDKIIPYFLGINEIWVYILYGLLIAYYLVYFRKILLTLNYWILLVALFLFGISIMTDIFDHSIDRRILYILEDGSKFIGISFWVAFQFTAAKTIVERSYPT